MLAPNEESKVWALVSKPRYAVRIRAPRQPHVTSQSARVADA